MNQYKEFKNPVILNPQNGIVYEDDLTKRLGEDYDWTAREPIFNTRQYNAALKAKSDDPLAVSDCYYGKYSDIAKDVYQKLDDAQTSKDRSLAAAIITSKEFTLLQDTTVLGSNDELIRQGILTQIFEEINTPNLKGDWATFANDVQYMTNIPESKSPEPSYGGYSETSIEVPKHGGAVAITDRARQVINGADVFARFVSQLQQKRIRSESIIVRDAIEAIASTNNQTGVDFGARSGTPPASTQNAIDLLNTLITFFDGTVGEFNTILSKSFIFNEFILNDTIRGGNTLNPLSPITSVQEQVSGVGVLPGVQWYRDNLMTSSTNLYIMDRNRAGKNFRGPTRAYTVTDPDTETEKYVTKSHFATYIVDGTLIARVTGVAG